MRSSTSSAATLLRYLQMNRETTQVRSRHDWQCLLLLSGVWSANLVLPYPIVAQTPVSLSARAAMRDSAFSMPSTLQGYMRQDSSAWISQVHPVSYRSVADSANTVVISIRRLAPDSTPIPSITTAHRILQAEVKCYLDSLPGGETTGAYEAYKIAYQQVADTTIQSLSIPGYTLSVAIRRQGAVTLRFMYWYVIQGWLVQAYATMPATAITTSTLPLFVHELVGHMVREVLAPSLP